jgi:hypothetical protein
MAFVQVVDVEKRTVFLNTEEIAVMQGVDRVDGYSFADGFAVVLKNGATYRLYPHEAEKVKAAMKGA